IVERAGPRIFKSANFSQITVVVARRFYLLKIGDLGPETTIEQLEEALTGLVQAAQHNRLQADEPAPGILTCADHATQCKAFRQLQKIGINVESLSAIRHSLLTLCLDLDSNPASYAEAAYLAHSGNCANRWHHSSLQLVVFGNAKACAICSFSAYLDGNTMMRAAAEIQKRAAARPLSNGLSRNAACLTPAVELRWQISGDLIRRARQDLQTVLDNQQATFEIEGLGQSFFAAHAVEPIPAFVVALAMTTKQLTGRAVGIVQFLAASKYRCLGLAVASVSTPEVKRFVDYLDGDDAQHAQTAALLREAIISQERECRKVRQRLPLAEIIALFVLSKKGVSRLYVTLVVALAFALLRLFGLYRPVENEVAVSHPVICPEAPVVGRPGARLPYQKYFGLHYQILEDRIIVTVMPSVRWMIPNVELIAVLSENLKRIQGIVEGAQR
ncbi:MAG: choline/carnitine O-acyltransferase, partial [Chloroflexota bacterium]